MNRRFSRPMTALLLALSLWTSAVCAIAAPQQQQTSQTQQKSDQKTDQKKDAASKPAPQTATTSSASSKTAGKTLSPDEDPSMIGKRNINHGLFAKMSGSLEKEVSFGRQLAAEVDRQAKFVDDPEITEYVNRVGQNLVLHSDAKVPFTIKVIDSDEVNAFALPGGFFYVNKGLILAADNEAELAGAMAHEIAHVAARHVMENQAKATVAQYAILIPAIVLGGGAGQLIYEAGNFGAMLGFSKFSRDAEAEADKLGVQYLYAAGYDPNAMATMFEKLAALNKKKPGTIARAFASHPQAADRRSATINLVARFPERDEYMISTSEFQRIKGKLLRLSNSRASTVGDLASDGDSTPGRPTLKRRAPTPDDPSATTDSNDQKTNDSKPAGPPKLKRNDMPSQTTQPQPSSSPQP